MSSSRKNPNIKHINTEVEITPYQIQEFQKCMVDPVYFTENYVKIQHPVKGAIPFKLYDYQKKLLNNYKNNRYNVVMAPRQTGKCVHFDTIVTIIKLPYGIKKILLWLFNKKVYNSLF